MIRFEIPELVTERLRLRLPRMSDLDAYAAFRGSERARTVGGPFSREDSFAALAAIVGQWQLRGYGRWLVADRDSDAPLGVVGVFHPEDWPEPEIAWTVFGPAEGRGIAHEAARATRRFVQDRLGWHRIVSLVSPDNPRSEALARRLGCVPEGPFAHPVHGDLTVWRHPAPAASAPAASAPARDQGDTDAIPTSLEDRR